MAAANGATISPQPSRAASSIDGFENDADIGGQGLLHGLWA